MLFSFYHVKKIMLSLVLMLATVFCGSLYAVNIAYITDIEGNKAKLLDFYKLNPAFILGADKDYHLAPGFFLVNGGDLCDRFPGERWVMREMLRLKEEAPDRVILIAGNRDINKIRLPVELSDDAIKCDPIRKGDDFRQWLQEKGLSNNRSIRLQWILERTMGAPKAFELRRRELALEKGVNPADITDDMVTESYVADTMPGGLMYRVLRASVLMAHIGKTLFVHSGICAPSIGNVPGSKMPEIGLTAWQTALNTWFQKAITSWEENLGNGGLTATPVGYDLVHYCEPVPGMANNPGSVVYGRELDLEGRVTLPSPPVINFLKSNGIYRLVLGHTPSGEIPVIQRLNDESFEMIVADTSYSPRSEEASRVLFSGLEEGTTTIQGQISIDGKSPDAVSFTIETGEKTLLGKQIANGGVVVTPLRKGFIVYRLMPGFKVQYEVYKPKNLIDYQ